MAYSATFDENDNLYIADMDRSRVLYYDKPTAFLPAILGFVPLNGPTGSAVIITGTSLINTTTLWFNGVSATFTVNSDTQLTAIVPAGATTGPISLTTPSGGARSPEDFGVTCTPPPVPVVTAPSTVGAGSPNRTASVPAHAGSTYSWTIGNGTITAGQGTNQIIFTAGIAGTPLTLSVTETNPSGCVSAPGSATVTVAPPGSAALFYTLTPCRVVDTRNLTGPLGAPPLQPGATRTFDAAAAACGVPAGAVAISVNLTVTNVWAPGGLVVFRSDISRPNAERNEFPGGSDPREQCGRAPRESGPDVLGLQRSTAAVDFILDVNGFFK